ncbi:MAG: hypothetical protein D6691_08110 [Candidatus Hydrogenedentota bacterium]|jgi:hypothetical protein|nr:hypothetical protein [Candidatus Sumerlaea chitinivorans]RMH26299.1 MAG: hypothetical protein D6691_08110 [Candidatus Hydrogenedentota bacterium]GIX43918.1 MAG: hypothetical protein KatS3mg130_0326 [Candidatus Sumerlaea sp.]
MTEDNCFTQQEGKEATQPQKVDLWPILHVRPTTLLEFLDRTFAFWRMHWRSLLILGLMGVLPTTLVNVFTWQVAPTNQEALEAHIVAMLPYYLVAMLLELWPIATIFSLTRSQYLAPVRSGDWGGHFLYTMRRLPSLILALFFYFVLIILGFSVVTGFLGAADQNGWAFPAALVVMGIVIYWGLSWMLVVPIVVSGAGHALSAFGQSARNMHARFHRNWWRDNAYWRALLIVVLWMGIRGAGLLVVRVLYLLATGRWVGLIDPDPQFLLIQSLSDGVISAFAVSWLAVALMLLYVETDIRAEGLDLKIRLLKLVSPSWFQESED